MPAGRGRRCVGGEQFEVVDAGGRRRPAAVRGGPCGWTWRPMRCGTPAPMPGRGSGPRCGSGRTGRRRIRRVWPTSGGVDLVDVAVQADGGGLGDGAAAPTTGTPRAAAPVWEWRGAGGDEAGRAASGRSRSGPGGGRRVSTQALNSRLSSTRSVDAAGAPGRARRGTGRERSGRTVRSCPGPAGRPGRGVDEADAEHRAGPQQLRGHERADRCRRRRLRDAAGGQGRRAAPPPAGRCPRGAPTGSRPAARQWSSMKANR